MAVGVQIAPVQLGPVRIEFPVALAAMSGYSDWPTRVLARRLGAGYAVAEAMLDQFVVNVAKGRKARRYLRVTDEDHPAGAQLMGSTADAFAPAAARLVEAGFDVIDVNFGCPVKKVLGRCRGGYLLSRPDRALEIVARVREALPPQVPLTLKMRRGTDDTAESRERFFRIFDGALARGVAAITVHGRTVVQKYEGRSSWEFLGEVKRHAGRHVVFGSGDLFTARDCLDMMTQTGVDGVTIARGAIGNPWIFREVRALLAGRPLPAPPTLDEQRQLIAEHYRLAEEVYGPTRACQGMGKFGIKYSRLHPQPEQVRDAFAAARRPEQWREIIRCWYGGQEMNSE
jgi:nifR3 family TIM-barrel protein